MGPPSGYGMVVGGRLCNAGVRKNLKLIPSPSDELIKGATLHEPFHLMTLLPKLIFRRGLQKNRQDPGGFPTVLTLPEKIFLLTHGRPGIASRQADRKIPYPG